MSRAIGRELKPGDEIVVTRLDHDANCSPWLQMAEDRGVTVRWAEIHDEDCTLDMADLAAKINSKTKLVAAGYASNAVGTINPVKEIVALAHKTGALAYIDAVHYTPHGLIDSARPTNFLARTWASSSASASTSSAYAPTKSAPSPTQFPTAGNTAR
jgi:selenocysteine lyase/cysteine desulfurase